jgi:hypothetical protein
VPTTSILIKHFELDDNTGFLPIEGQIPLDITKDFSVDVNNIKIKRNFSERRRAKNNNTYIECMQYRYYYFLHHNAKPDSGLKSRFQIQIRFLPRFKSGFKTGFRI